MSGAKVNRAAHLVTSTTIAKPRSATSATANSATARLATGGSTTATTTNPVHHRYYHGVSTDIGRKRVNQDVYLVCESLFAVTGVTGAPSSGSASPATTPAIIRAKTSVATRAKTPVVTRAKTPMVTRPGTSGKSSVVREVSAPAPGTASNTGAARRPLMEGNKAHMPSRRATTVTATTTRHDVSPKANNTDKIATFPTVHCYAVLDGHGEHGHIIANYVKDNLLQWFRTDLPRRRRQFFANPAQTITEAFLDVDDRLCSSESIDVWLSGTTCVAVFMWSDRMVVANVGDSRAVLVTGDVGSSPCPLGGMKSERLNDSGYDEARQLEMELEAKLHVSHEQTIVQLTT